MCEPVDVGSHSRSEDELQPKQCNCSTFLDGIFLCCHTKIIVQSDPAVISNTSNLINMMHNLTVKFNELCKSASLSVSKFNFSSINSLLLQLEASFLDLAPLSKRFWIFIFFGLILPFSSPWGNISWWKSQTYWVPRIMYHVCITCLSSSFLPFFSEYLHKNCWKNIKSVIFCYHNVLIPICICPGIILE